MVLWTMTNKKTSSDFEEATTKQIPINSKHHDSPWYPIVLILVFFLPSCQPIGLFITHKHLQRVKEDERGGLKTSEDIISRVEIEQSVVLCL